jgi:hypothetical protein
VGRNADGGVAAPCAGQVADEVGKGCGEHDRFAAQPDAGVVVADLDVVEGQAADRGGLLGVEQDKQASDAVLGIEGVVVQQVAGSGPSTRGISDALNTLPLR